MSSSISNSKDRSVRHLSFKLAGTLAVFALFFAIGERIARSMYATETSLGYQLEMMDKQVDRVETLILGNSHTAFGLNPAHLGENTFNLAFPSQDLYYDYRLLERYLPQADNLKTVILTVDYFSFGFDETEIAPHMAKEYIRCAGMYPEWPLDLTVLSSYSAFFLHRESFWRDWLKGKSPDFLYTIRGSYDPDRDESSDGHYDSGFVNPGMAPFQPVPSRPAFHQNRCFDPSQVARNQALLGKTVDLALSKGARVLLITPPYSQPYRDGMAPEFVAQFHADLAAVLADRNPDLCRYVDFSSVLGYPTEAFINPDHLNAQSARHFSGIVDDLIAEWNPARSGLEPIAKTTKADPSVGQL